MRNKGIVAALGAAVLLQVTAKAQGVGDAYLFSNTSAQGSARSLGFGSALGSIGGDASTMSVNPAGLGVYRSSELSFTPSFKINGSSSEFLGQLSSESNVRFNVNHFALVLTDAPKGKRYDRRKWKTVSFGFSMNRIADFNRDYSYAGYTDKTSASLAFENSANADTNNIRNASTPAYMGWETGLLNGYAYHYTTAVPYGEGITQLLNTKERGGIREYCISLGGNYMEKLLIGATLGIDDLSYNRKTTYTEVLNPAAVNNPYYFKSFTYNDNLDVTGTGVNLKLGVIYKPTDFLRFGAAYHTPTIFNLHEVGTNAIAASYTTGNTYSLSSSNYLPLRTYDYTFFTPSKYILSTSIIIKKVGFITADYEYINYNKASYNLPDTYDATNNITYASNSSAINNEISKTYTSTSNFRVGAEIKLTKEFMIRGGWGYYGNPYKNAAYDAERMDISGGVGYRSKNFFADLGWMHSNYTFKEKPYAGVKAGLEANIGTATIDQAINNVALTFGLKF